eukprot:COSAG01_NODE_25555_length_741_cov_0.772586_2_plen_50_part_01
MKAREWLTVSELLSPAQYSLLHHGAVRLALVRRGLRGEGQLGSRGGARGS